MKIKDSEINVILCFEGKEVELDEISRCLDIIPSKTRTPNDWPEVIKHHKNELPDELKPRYTWELDINYKNSRLVSERFEEMLKILKGKEDIIKELKDRYALSVSFTVGVHAQHDQCNMPEMFLTKDIISFISTIGADIGFDMYLD